MMPSRRPSSLSILTVGFDATDVESWRASHTSGVVFTVGAPGSWATDALNHDVVVFDTLGAPDVISRLPALRAQSPGVGLVAVVENGDESPALVAGAHEVLSTVHGFDDLIGAAQDASLRAGADIQARAVIHGFGDMAIPMYRTLMSGEIVGANDALAAMLGVTRSDLIGRDASEFYQDVGARRRVVRALLAGDSGDGVSANLLHRSGRAIPAIIVGRLRRDAFGRPIHAEGVILTSQQSPGLLAAGGSDPVSEWMFHHSPVALWELDYSLVARRMGSDDFLAALDRDSVENLLGDVKVRRVNAAARSLVDDLGNGRTLGLPLDFGSDTGLATAQIRAIGRGETQMVREVTTLDARGMPHHARVVWLAATFDYLVPYSRVVVAVIDDTVEHLHRLTLERAVEGKDEFISSVAHHLRTPLTAILGFGRELQSDDERFTAREIEGMLGDVVAAAQAATNIVEDMAVAARVELDTIEVTSRSVSLSSEIKRVVEEVGADVRVGPVDIDVRADAARTRQILRALLSNALEHGGEDPAISAQLAGSMVHIEVTDDGPGPHGEFGLFDRYGNGEPSSTIPAPIGIGLHVARSLARRMGGDLDYLRRDGRTVFRLALPAL